MIFYFLFESCSENIITVLKCRRIQFAVSSFAKTRKLFVSVVKFASITVRTENLGHGGFSWITVCVSGHLTKEMNHVQAWKCYSVFQEQSRSLFQVSKSPLFLLESAANNSALKFHRRKSHKARFHNREFMMSVWFFVWILYYGS